MQKHVEEMEPVTEENVACEAKPQEDKPQEAKPEDAKPHEANSEEGKSKEAKPKEASKAEIVNKPKSFFDNPHLLQGLKLAAYEEEESKKAEAEKTESPRERGEAAVSDRMVCSVCGGVTFETRPEQKQHYKSDWHRFNLKQRIKGVEPVTVERFEEAVAGDISSISGSDSDSESDSDDAPKPSLPPKARATKTDSDEDEESYHIEGIGRRHPRVFFRNADNDLVSVYRCVIHGKKNAPENRDELLAMAGKLSGESLWIVMMLAGGHFAAGVFKGGEVVARKTFHRYVVRAKRGTVQSARDSQGHAPKSKGASLRREQERQLALDVQNLLESWSEHMEGCHRIFLRASGAGRQMLLGGKTPILKKSDVRIRSVPFSTRRPTHRELLRVHGQLTAVHVHDKDLGIADFIPGMKPKAADSPRRSPKAHRPKAKQADATVPPEDQESEEDNNTAVELVVQDQIIDFSDLKQFDATKRPKKKKKKEKEKPEVQAKHQQSPGSEPMDEELYHTRNNLYTACKVGDLARLQSLLDSLNSKNPITEETNTDTLPQSETATQSSKGNSDQSGASSQQTEGLTQNSSQSEPSTETGLNQSEQQDCQTEKEKSLGAETNTETKPETKPETQAETKAETQAETKPETKSENDVPTVLNMPFGDNSTTLLHVAAKESHKAIVNALMEAGADPAIKERGGMTPYMVGGSKDVRNEFRRFMGRFPERYDYARGQIPGPLTDEMEAEKKMKEAEKKKQQKKAKKERQKEQKAADAVIRAEEEEKRRYAALSDREKRALAAEKRLAAQYTEIGAAVPVISRCFECACDMTGKVPFEYSDNKFCSPSCMKQHRMKAKKS